MQFYRIRINIREKLPLMVGRPNQGKIYDTSRFVLAGL